MVIPAPNQPRRLVYLGTPDVACEPLRALHAAGFEIALVVTGADKRRGRGRGLSPSPVKALALELGLPMTTVVDEVLEVGADLGVVVAFGRIIKPHVLDQLAMVNLHFSLLPEWRGAAPVERAILSGDQQTGVCLMAVEEGLDTGGVYRREVVDIDPDETLDELRGRLVHIGAQTLVEALTNGLGEPETQVGEATYAKKIQASDLEINWGAEDRAIHAVVRVGDAWTKFRDKRLKIHRTERIDSNESSPIPLLEPGQLSGVYVGTGSGPIRLVEVQPEGKGRQEASAWLNGARPSPTDRLGT